LINSWLKAKIDEPLFNALSLRDTAKMKYKKYYYVYILASKPNGTIYVGMTDDLIRRVQEHKQGLVKGFTKTYGVKTLVYYEQTELVLSAIAREKQLKRWKRDWKIRLIQSMNPEWKELYNDLV
jgi:putative endonuclease